MYKKLLVTLDQSKLSEAVLPELQKLLQGRPAEVTLLTVARPPHATRGPSRDPSLVVPVGAANTVVVEPAPPVYGETKGQAIERTEHELLEYLEELSGPIRETGSQVRAVVRLGRPDQEIIDFARESGCDLIVMATHGRSGLSELVQGSVAEAVVKSGVTPVLLVRPRRPQRKRRRRGTTDSPARTRSRKG